MVSEGKSIFSEAGEGNSGGVTAISLDDEAENARSRKREILAVRQQDFRSRLLLSYSAVRAPSGRKRVTCRKPKGFVWSYY